MKQIILIYLVIALNMVFPEVRFVRPGNPTPVPPYTSWATASDSVQKCINVSQPYDTVYLAAGVYKERVVLKEHMSLIGIGIDSSIFDFSAHTGSLEYIVRAVNGGYIGGISFIMPLESPIGVSRCILIASYDASNLGQIESIKVNGNKTGILVVAAGCRISNSIFIGVNRPLSNPSGQYGKYYFNNNLVYKFPLVAGLVDGEYFEAYNNTLVTIQESYLFDLTGINFVSIRNNIAFRYSHGIYRKISGPGILSAGEMINNIIYGENNGFSNPTAGVRFYTSPLPNFKIVNNIFSGVDRIIETIFPTDTARDVNYNIFHNYSQLSNGVVIGSNNIEANPMVKADSADFRLDINSPAINAGDPTILDVDGSRSDIGPYGGPFGISYEYQDYPPRTPFNLSAVQTGDTLQLRWRRNTESDFRNYIVYRDSVSNFMVDSSKIIAQPTDTFYTFMLRPGINSFRVSAVDRQENISIPSQALSIGVTDTREDETKEFSYDEIGQNYPNPFNGSTVIPVHLTGPRYVIVELYSITGEQLGYAANGYYEQGYHEIRIGSYIQQKKLPSGIIFYRYTIKSPENIPLRHGLGKMILLK